MGTCPSAHSVVERGTPADEGDSQAAPAFGKGRVMKRGATGREGLTNGAADDDGGEDLEAQAARGVLTSGVQRWCLDVSEWGGLSTDQASEMKKEAGSQGGREREAGREVDF